MRNVYLLMMFVFVLTGCSQIIQEGAAPGVKVDSASAPYAKMRMNTVNIIDKKLQDWEGRDAQKWSKITVESTNSRRTQTGTLEAWGVLRNRTDYPLQIEGRVTFMDSYQVPIEEPSMWKRIIISPKSFGTYKEFSTRTSEVSFYYIEIREGK